MAGVFRGRFRSLYLVTKVITFYISAYLIFYFWPLFLGRIVIPDFGDQLTVIAGSLLTPLGFLCAGGYFGKKVVGIHFLVLLLVCAATWLLWPQDMAFTPPNLNERFAPAMMLGYAIGMVFGVRVEMVRAPWDSPAG